MIAYYSNFCFQLHRSKVLIFTIIVIVVLVCSVGYVPYSERETEDNSDMATSRSSSHFTMLSQSHSRGRTRSSRRHGYASISHNKHEMPSMSTLITLFQNGEYPPLNDYNLSDDEVTMVAQLFNINGLDSSVSLQREFLGCPAKNLIRDTSVREFVDERFVLTKQYQTCKKLTFKKQRGMVGLSSFPGSGNSWVRQLLETSTGVFTGSVYCDKSYVHAGMVGEGIRSEFVVAVKCHRCRRARTFEQLSKLIYVVRNPFDAILSEFTRESVRHINNANATSNHVAELGSSGLSK